MTDLADLALAPPNPGARRLRWRLGAGFLLRVGGQPADVPATLRTSEAATWVERVFDREAARDTAGDALRTQLEQVIATTPDTSPHRGALINLRRDVFNTRRPRPATVQRAEPGLPTTARAMLGEWMSSLDALATELDSGAAILRTDVARTRELARELLADDDLRSGVLLQSEILEKNMNRYLDPNRKLDKSARRIERTLLELLYRAALKTSPFSTLTSVGLGTFDSSTGRTKPRPVSLRQHSSARLNVAVLARLAMVILADAGLRSQIKVSLAPGASLDGDTIRYVRRRTAASSDPDAVVAIDSVHEDLFFLPSGPALADVVDLTREARPSLEELAEAVAAADEGRSVAEADKLLGHLLRLGFLLAPQLQVDLRASDPATVFASALDAHDHPVLRQVAEHLRRAGALVDGYPQTPGDQRADLLGQVREQVRAGFEAVSAPPELVPRTLVYEDTTIASDGLNVDLHTWERLLLPDLAELADILPAFDLNLPRRFTANGFFRARYGVGGRCDDVVRFCHEFQRDFFDPYVQRSMRRSSFDENNAFVRQENWFKLTDISALDDAREAASRHLRSVYSSFEEQPEEIKLGPDFIHAVRDRLPDEGRFHQPWSFFVQLTADGTGTEPSRPVLNQAYAGMTLMFSRFAHSLDTGGADATGMIRRVLDSSTNDGAVLAELRGGYETTNLNVHPSVTDYEIICPGDTSTRPADEQIPLEDLALIHDTHTDRIRLHSDRLGREVVPVYLGFLMPMALPEVQQVLMCFSPSGMAQIDLWAGTGDPVPAEGVTMYPRLVLGDLVLQRRMWKLSTDAFPSRDPSHSDAEHFLRVQRWRRRHSLPRRLFAQNDVAASRNAVDDSEAVEPADDSGRKVGRKPLPVDFDSWYSLQLLEQLALGASSRIVLTEPLPDTDQLWLRDENGRPYVSEFLVELYDSPNGHDEGGCHVR